MISHKEKLLHYCLILLTALGLLISVIPVLCFLIGILIYRGCAWLLLKRQFGSTFGGFLTSHDALWGVEEDNSWSVIHSLLLFEAPGTNASPCDLAGALEDRLKTRLLQKQFSKVFMKRRVKYGYNFLVNVRTDEVKLSEYLKLVDVPSNEDFVSKLELQSWISGMYNQKLPDDHSNFLEILVSRKIFEGPQKQPILLPVLIRIHHSLADGVAIVKMMLTTPLTEIINSDGKEQDRSHSRRIAEPPPVIEVLKNVLKALVILPQIVLNHRKPDFNSLHGDQSSPKNFINWYFETAAETRLLNKIKSIKAAMESEIGITFQDVICLSLSVALQHHFAAAAVQCNLFSTPPSPEWITFGNAVQLGEARKMTNNCAYNFERIPITAPAVTKGDLVGALREIRKARADVSKFQQINYMVIRLCSLLPARYLRRMVSRDRCSLGLSNIPGPVDAINVGPFLISHLTFWTPNRFKTRLGLSLFTLGDRLHLGIGGDEVGFATNAIAESDGILQGIVTEINRMYKIVTE